jgi:uncharacterized protein
MRIFVISDLHGSSMALKAALPKAESCSLILFAGDLTDFGGEAEARALLELFGSLKSKLLAVPGNCDKKGARELLESEGLSVEGTSAVKTGLALIGSGGGPRWTGITPYEKPDEELARALYKGADALQSDRVGASSGLPLIVVSHAPPKGSGADLSRGSSIGSASLAAALERLRPVLWVCGHIHESPCAAYVGRTLVINPGPLKEGRYAIAELDQDVSGAWRAKAVLFRQ